MIPMTCTCGKTIGVKDEHAGRRIRCPACNTAMSVPVPGMATVISTEQLRDRSAGETRSARSARLPMFGAAIGGLLLGLPIGFAVRPSGYHVAPSSTPKSPPTRPKTERPPAVVRDHPATPAEQLADLDAGHVVAPNDPKLAEIQALLSRAREIYRQDEHQIGILTMKFVNNLRADGLPTRCDEFLDALTYAIPENKPGAPPYDFNEFAGAYWGVRSPARHTHTRAVCLMQVMAKMIGDGEIPVDSLPQFRKDRDGNERDD